VSRIESGEIDPTWSVMQSVLNATGWRVAPEATESARLIPAAVISRAMASSLRKGDAASAVRDLTEGVGRLIQVAERGGSIPAWVGAEPERPIGDPVWDVFLATAYAYALQRAGHDAPRWMTETPALPEETVPGDDPSPEYRSWLRARTPSIFRAKNILSRPEDWAIA
jgi:hypothetical protein